MSSESNPVELKQQAESYLAQRKLDEAEAACLKALNIEPNYAPACKTFGDVMLAKGEIQLAKDWYAKAIAIYSYQLASDGNSTESNTEFAKTYANFGSLYAKQQQWKSAINYYQKAIELQPNFAGCYRNLAKVYQQLNQKNLATEYWMQALIIEPNIGIDEAISFYEKTLEDNPRNLKIRKQLTDILIKKGELERGISILRRGIELNPQFPWFHYNLGEALTKSKQLEPGIAAYFRAVALQPNKLIFRKKLEDNLQKQSQLKQAIATKFNSVEAMVNFTILCGNGSGFTDQILQFSMFYKLGLSLGYSYIHTEFSSYRSSEEIYNFLGFNQYWKLNAKHLNLSDYQLIYLEFNDDFLKLKINNLKQLHKYCQDIVGGYPGDKNQVIVIFKLIGSSAARQKLLLLINSNIKDYQDNLNLRKIYFETNPNNPNLTNYFTSDKIKLLIHIRAGDIAGIKTPWGPFIKSKATLLRESRIASKKLDELDWFVDRHELIEPKEYYRFARDFTSGLGKQNFSTCIFSDGYQRSFDFLINNLDKTKLTPEQTQQIIDLNHSYETEKYSLFHNLENSTCIIGESDKKLFNLINCSLIADIFIIGYQQRMIPKFLANYYDLERPPIVFILFKNRDPSSIIRAYICDLALDSRKATVIPVNLEDYQIGELVEIAQRHLGEKQNSGKI